MTKTIDTEEEPFMPLREAKVAIALQTVEIFILND